MSKEETCNTIGDNGSIESERPETKSQFGESSAEALCGSDSGKGDSSIDRSVNDKLSNDQSEFDLTKNGDISSNNQDDKIDTSESQSKSEGRPESETSGSGPQGDSNDLTGNETAPVLNESSSDAGFDKSQSDVNQGDVVKEDSDTAGEDNTHTDGDSVNAKDNSSGEEQDTSSKNDKSSDKSSNSRSGSVGGEDNPSEQEETIISSNDKGSKESDRRGSNADVGGSREAITKTPDSQNKIVEESAEGEPTAEKVPSQEVSEPPNDDSAEAEEYADDFEETEEYNTTVQDTPEVESSNQEHVITSDNTESNKETPDKDVDNTKNEGGVEAEEYEDDFSDTEAPSKSSNKEAEHTEEDGLQDKAETTDASSEQAAADTEIPEDEGKEIDEPADNVTKVIVNDDGIPKVLVTTVPDRPPSSQASDTEARDEGITEVNITQTDSQEPNGTVSQASVESSVDNHDYTENKVTSNTSRDNNTGSDNTGKISEVSENVTNDQADTSKVVKEDKGDIERKWEEPTETSEEQNNDKGEATANVKTKFSADIDSTPEEKVPDTMATNADKTVGENTTDNAGSKESEAKADGASKDSSQAETEQTSEQKDDKKPVEPEPQPEPEPDPIKQESPLDKLLQRHVEIDGTVESITQLETNVVKLLSSMKEVMSHYLERLKLQTLKDITEDMGKFRGDFTSVNEAFNAYSSMSVKINQKLKELRHVSDDVKSQINRKFVTEDLSTWVDVTPEQEKEKERLQDEVFAAEKRAMARAAEARQAMATATVGVAQANQFVTELEVQTAEAEAIAVKAAAQAKASLVAAEEARKAAEERRIAEEASKKRAEERAKAKAEEAKKKAAEEEMQIHMEAAKKGTSVEDEREKFMREKERKEAERRNPKNWPKYSYTAAGVDFNPPVGCVIRAIEGSMRVGDVDCATVDQSTHVLKLRENEELVSNIIRLNPTDADRKFMFEEPMSIALPVCFNRVMLGREAVVKQLMPNGAWKELPSNDVQFEEFREAKFVEGRSRSFGTFAVVLRLKKDSVQFGRRTGRVVSSVDSRISFSTQSGTFKTPNQGILEVQSLDVNTVPELKFRSPVECDGLLTSSPIIRLTLPTKTLGKPLQITVPLPSSQTKQTRPATGIARPTASDDARPATARVATSKEEENPEDIRFVYKDDKNGWTVNKKLLMTQIKNKDIVVFDIEEPYERFVVLRIKQGVKDVVVEKVAAMLEKTLTQRNVKVSLRQHQHDASEIAIVCTTSARTKKALNTMEEEGYTDGPIPSPDLILQEGQQLYMKFRGNVQYVTEKPSLDFVFNSHIRTTRKFQVTEVDVYAQKSIHCFRGFVQVFTTALVPKPLAEGAQKPASGQPEMMETEVLLAELLVELPKPEPEPPRPLRTAPVPLQDGPLTHLVFRHLASELGKEWRELGTHLNLRPTRIQAILRQNVNKDTPQTRYDMLVTWAKRIPKGVDKTQILQNALLACGRPDLAEEVRYKGDQFRQQRLNRARSSHLKQAFVKVAKCQAVFRHWQNFAKRLGVPEEEIKRIDESGGSGQQKCYTSLQQWEQVAGEQASIPELSTQLKSVKQPTLSREVESIMAT